MGILMHAAVLPSKAHEAARTLNHKLQPAHQQKRCGLQKEILNQQKISTAFLIITQQHTTGEKLRTRETEFLGLISTQNRPDSFWRWAGANLAMAARLRGQRMREEGAQRIACK
jgi:hypothetical protein